MTSQLSDKMGEMQESVEEQVGNLAETFKNEFGEGMAKVCNRRKTRESRCRGVRWRCSSSNGRQPRCIRGGPSEWIRRPAENVLEVCGTRVYNLLLSMPPCHVFVPCTCRWCRT